MPFAKRLILGLLSVLLGACSAATYCPTTAPTSAAAAATSATPADDYRLVWSDEFNIDGAPNPDNWGYEQGFVRNNELQWYQPDNARCQGGLLIIEARRESKPIPEGARLPAWAASRPSIEYTSASMNTRGKHAWLYGRFVMRARIDVRPGSWPAFWTLGTTGPWPSNGEIDVMEYYRNMVLANIAWGGARGAQWNTGRTPLAQLPADWATQFHIWRMDWNPDSIKLYVDDVLFNSQDLSVTINQARAGGQGRAGGGGRRGGARGATAATTAPARGPAFARGPNMTGLNPFHFPAYILLNQAIGGQQGGDPSTTQFPIRYEIDFVRVYQTPAQMHAVPDTAPAALPATATAPR